MRGSRSFGPPQLGRGILGYSTPSSIALPFKVFLHGNSQLQFLQSRLQSALPTVNGVAPVVTSRVVGGASTPQLKDELAAQVPAFVAGKRNIIVMLEVIDHTNDYGADGYTTYNAGVDFANGATAYAACAAYAAQSASVAPNFECWVCTCIDTTEYDSPDVRATYRDDCNALLRANIARLIDLEANAVFNAALNAAANATYYSDGIHPTTTGTDVMASVMAARLVT